MEFNINLLFPTICCSTQVLGLDSVSPSFIDLLLQDGLTQEASFCLLPPPMMCGTVQSQTLARLLNYSLVLLPHGDRLIEIKAGGQIHTGCPSQASTPMHLMAPAPPYLDPLQIFFHEGLKLDGFSCLLLYILLQIFVNKIKSGESTGWISLLPADSLRT